MEGERSNFITNEIEKDIAAGRCGADEIYTRFPPEPNGYLHIGHAKAICINFQTAQQFGGKTNLRFDDTNPLKEDEEYVDSIIEDIRWLGFEPDRILYASSYFDQMYEYACELIRKGLAYVDDQTTQQIRDTKGSFGVPGINSPYRDRSVEENLHLFQLMKEGKFGEGEKVLRAKIDMQSPNMNLRDPVIYRIVFANHHQTGDQWCIYPLYDYAHPLEDAIEGITHSLCSLEFEDHRVFYDWLLGNLDDFQEKRPRQIEFARLNITNTVMSKRFLKALVDSNVVDGWDDPRMPTICGLRRRGVPANAIVRFCDSVGVAKANSVVDASQLDYFIREELFDTSDKQMVVLDPLKVVITNYPDATEMLPFDQSASGQEHMVNLPFSNEIFIERSDFMIDPPKKYFRLYPGNEVRLMNAYFITCTGYDTDEQGNVVQVYATYDPQTKSGSGFSGRKVKGTIHWVDAHQYEKIKVRIYDSLLDESKADAQDLLERVNPHSMQELDAVASPDIVNTALGDVRQFIRQGFFVRDYKHKDTLLFNKTIGMKSSYKPKN